MSEWQPIETAPKDGTDILLFDGENKVIAIATWVSGAEGYWGVFWSSQEIDKATHWMPLPAPPTK